MLNIFLKIMLVGDGEETGRRNSQNRQTAIVYSSYI